MRIEHTEAWTAHRRLLEYFTLPEARHSSIHPWKSGQCMEEFFDFDHLVSDPWRCEDVVRLYAEQVQALERRHRVDYLAFIEKPRDGIAAGGGTIGALLIAGAVSIRTGIGSLCVRLSKDLVGERVKKRPTLSTPAARRLRGTGTLLLTDHISTGNEALLAADALSHAGAETHAVVAYTLRPDQTDWEGFQERGFLPDRNLYAFFHLPRDWTRAERLREDWAEPAYAPR